MGPQPPVDAVEKDTVVPVSPYSTSRWMLEHPEIATVFGVKEIVPETAAFRPSVSVAVTVKLFAPGFRTGVKAKLGFSPHEEQRGTGAEPFSTYSKLVTSFVPCTVPVMDWGFVTCCG